MLGGVDDDKRIINKFLLFGVYVLVLKSPKSLTLQRSRYSRLYCIITANPQMWTKHESIEQLTNQENKDHAFGESAVNKFSLTRIYNCRIALATSSPICRQPTRFMPS